MQFQYNLTISSGPICNVFKSLDDIYIGGEENVIKIVMIIGKSRTVTLCVDLSEDNVLKIMMILGKLRTANLCVDLSEEKANKRTKTSPREIFGVKHYW